VPTLTLNQEQKRNIRNALLVLIGYMFIYFVGRVIWCTHAGSSLLGWLFLARPTGVHSYLYGWLLSSHLFWYALVLSALPSPRGRFRFSAVTTAGFALGLIAGMIWGPYPDGATIGHNHYGWAIWGGVYLGSIVIGIIAERCHRMPTA
jgi:hypothetical protein